MKRFFKRLRKAVWRGFEHEMFMVAKGAAYSCILTLFPSLMLLASVLALSPRSNVFVREISYALDTILPPGSGAPAIGYFQGEQHRSLELLFSALMITLIAASGVMISWMEGFRHAYEFGVEWDFWKERGVAFLLVLLSFLPMTFAALIVAFGSQIESRVVFYMSGELQPYLWVLWRASHWFISILTSAAILALIYHWGVPRTQPIYKVLPGAFLATVIWLPATLGFGWYVTHVATYNLIYGPLGTAIVLLLWFYYVSVIILVGAEFNAVIYPRESGKDRRVKEAVAKVAQAEAEVEKVEAAVIEADAAGKPGPSMIKKPADTSSDSALLKSGDGHGAPVHDPAAPDPTLEAADENGGDASSSTTNLKETSKK